MSDEQDRIKHKIHALLQKTVDSGCTEAEAMLAAAKAGELMDFYNINITDVEIRDSKCKHLKIELDTVIGGRLDACIVSIGKFCDCKTWFTRGIKKYKGPITRGGTYNFFGLEQDVEVAIYLYKILDRAIDIELKAFKKTPAYTNCHRKKAATKSFSTAFAIRIYRRLNEMKKVRDEELVKKEAEIRGNTGTALLIIKQDHIEAEFESELGFTLTKRKVSRQSYNADASRAGAKAADRVNLNKGIGNKTTALLS